MAQNYGVVELKEYEKADGTKEKSLFMKANSQVTISVSYFQARAEHYMHITKKDRKYYLPLSWGEVEDLDLKKLKEEFEAKLHLLDPKTDKSEERKGDVRHVVMESKRAHPYQRPKTNAHSSVQFQDEFEQYLASQHFQ